MNSKQIAFIIYINDEMKYEECRYYLDRLYVPEGYEKDIITIKEAPSMAAGYNAGMQSSDAKYKVYLHQDVFIINRNFIVDMLSVFHSDAQIGLVGMIGTKNLGEDAYAVVKWNSGKVIDNCGLLLDFLPKDGIYMEVQALDGLLLATQYDIGWRGDLFDGWDFYDISQCMEFKRAGYKVVVPYQKEPWCYHDNEYSEMDEYDELFIREYHNMGNYRMREGGSVGVYKDKGVVRQKISSLFSTENRQELRDFFENPDCQGFLFLREYEVISKIDVLERQAGTKLRFWNDNMLADQILHKFQVLKYAVKRLEYGTDHAEEDKAFLEENYSKYAIMVFCGYYVRYKDEIYMQLGSFLTEGDETGWILEQIYAEMKKDYRNYALYYLLGLYLEESNVNQAFLCMENAEFYCEKVKYKEWIQREKDYLAQREDFLVKPVSIVILSYNLKSICMQCIESIRKNNNPVTYEMIVVDNGSSDGVYEWLKEQKDIK